MTVNGAEAEVLRRLESNGFKAYLVGGCVRDRLMGRPVHDVDIATSALPEEVMAVFSDMRTIPTGLKHGTVTVICGGSQYEITTFRIDGGYTDSRRPDSVQFTPDIREDLARRDFTMNAIAMDADGSVVDPFGGEEDIRRSVIRCVGEPERRFTEDALRILRGVRFASQLGFTIEAETEMAMLLLRGRLDLISRERVREEFDKLLCGTNCVEALLRYREIIAQIIPEIEPCFGFDQHSHYHRYDVYSHIVHTIEAVPDSDLLLRRTMFFHDIGKPPMFTMDESGEGHFKGHAGLSAEMAETIMERLRYDRRTIERTSQLVRRHSDKIKTERQIKRLVGELGLDGFRQLMAVKTADNSAKNDFVTADNELFADYCRTAERLVAEGSCLQLSQLAVSGKDMLTLGLEGRAVGEALSELLDKVIDGELPNEKNALTDYIRGKIND
ncbi:MAG: CCA tRNA nucleotidyltransferase [Ruminococcus sp.]|nr:CCA tRNA nucleotidyltransferase [Ruminococcus sp.]